VSAAHWSRRHLLSLAVQVLAPRSDAHALHSSDDISGPVGVGVGVGCTTVETGGITVGEFILYEYVPQPWTSTLPAAAIMFCSPMDGVSEECSRKRSRCDLLA
jgi:hypothetical protein